MIDLSSVKEPAVKKAVQSLEGTVDFRKLSTKGANGYVAFGHHMILNRDVAVKCYYWGGEDRYHAEPRGLAAIESPNVTEIHHAERIDDEWSLFITPYYSRGDLDDPENIFLSDAGQAVIGEFGSVKLLPESEERIPGLWTLASLPPSRVCRAQYVWQNRRLYQCGLLLYQLLGGPLPYAEVAWLNKGQRKQYNEMSDPVDRTVFVDQVLKQRMTKGRLRSLKDIKPWVPDPLLRVVRKAANKSPSSRYSTVANFMATLDKTKIRIPDWKKVDGTVVMAMGSTRRRVRETVTGTWRAEPPRDNGWQKDGSVNEGSISEVVAALNDRYVE